MLRAQGALAAKVGDSLATRLATSGKVDVEIRSGMKLSDEAAAQIAAEYVLGGQAPGVRRAVERRVLRDPELAAQLRRWQELATDLSASHTAERVPDRVWLRIRAQLPTPAPKRRERQGWQRYWVWQGWAGAAVALALAVGVLPMLRQKAPADAALLSAPSAPVASSLPTTASSGAAPAAAVAAPSSATVAKPSLSAPNPAIGPSPVPPVATNDSTRVIKMPTAPMATQRDPGVADAAQAVAGSPAIDGPQEATVDGSPVGAAVTPSTPAAAVEKSGPQDKPNEPASEDNRDARRFTTRGLEGPANLGAAISTLASKQGAAAWQVRLDEDQDALQVSVVAPQDAGEAHDFELWAIPDDGGAPQAIGVISGVKDVVLALDSRTRRSMRMAQALAVSIEPVGGSPNSGPTGPVNYSGPVQHI